MGDETTTATGASSAGNDTTNQQQSSAAAGANNQEQGTEVRDPAAFHKAEAEKFQRLHAKAQAEAEAAKKQIESMTAEQAKQLQAEIEKLQKQSEATQAEAAKAMTDALKMQALAAKGLNAEEYLEFLDGVTDPEAIKARVEKLAAKVPQRGSAGGGHKTGGGASGTTLTMDEIRKMSPAEIAKRKTEVDAVLRSQKQ